MTNYLIYTGNFYPYKNIPILISAATKLKLTIYLVGKNSIFAKRLPLSEYVEIKSGLTDAQIINLYQHALCFVMPSLHEGMGLPGLEAMASGCPVIAANASCLPEIYGEAALFFDPTSTLDLIEKITTLQNDPALRSALIAKGLVQSKKYSWTTMANQTWEIYKQILQ
jgi:glycosyltransferase involved in cell wall biosynthesis